jgi:hypothetical protein
MKSLEIEHHDASRDFVVNLLGYFKREASHGSERQLPESNF